MSETRTMGRFFQAIAGVLLCIAGGAWSAHQHWWGPIASFVGAFIVGRLA